MPRKTKEARNAYHREWRLLNPAKARAATKKWRESHKVHIKNARMQVRYKISLDSYNQQLDSQNNICGACKQPFTNTELGAPVLDHNHKNEQIREFVHKSCNTALGMVKDNAVSLRLLAEYVEKHNAVS